MLPQKTPNRLLGLRIPSKCRQLQRRSVRLQMLFQRTNCHGRVDIGRREYWPYVVQPIDRTDVAKVLAAVVSRPLVPVSGHGEGEATAEQVATLDQLDHILAGSWRVNLVGQAVGGGRQPQRAGPLGAQNVVTLVVVQADDITPLRLQHSVKRTGPDLFGEAT